MAGRPYEASGIRVTTEATRAATDDQLRALAAHRRAEALRAGITHLEIKSGYGLDVDSERRLCEIAAELTDDVTFLGAHAVPPEYEGRADDYVELVCGEMLGGLRAAGALDRRVLRAGCIRRRAVTDGAGRRHLRRARPPRARQPTRPRPRDRLAVEMGAASVDHCTYFDDTDIEALAASETVATFLPATDFSTRQPYPDARRMIDAGARVAIATNTNPGSSNTTSMSFCIALAVREMGMTIEDAVVAATLGGAGALRRDDLGVLGPGARADAIILDATSYIDLVYRPGCPWSTRSFSRGNFATSGGSGLPRRPPRETRRAPSPAPGGSLQRPSRRFSSPADVATISVGVTPTSKRLPYMPGMDALRAIAVLAVFVYHPNGGGWMPGGFLGVDVFFVISGYLITSLLLSEFRAGRPRRARRASGCGGRGACCPAVGVLIAVTMVVAAIVEPEPASTPCAATRSPRSPTSTNWHLIFEPPVLLRAVRSGPRCSATSGRSRSRSSSTCSGRSSSPAGMTLLRPPAAAASACSPARSPRALLHGHPLRPERHPTGSTTAPTPRRSALLVGVALAFVWHPERPAPATTGPLAPAAARRGRGARALATWCFTLPHRPRLRPLPLPRRLPAARRSGPRCWSPPWPTRRRASAGCSATRADASGSGCAATASTSGTGRCSALTRPGIDVPLHGPVLIALQLARRPASPTSPTAYVEQPFRRSTSWQRPDWLRIGRPSGSQSASRRWS